MAVARTKAEKRLHTFIGVVAFMERTGNGLGRLVLIWATVVVGFAKNLGLHFWFLVALVFLESFRAFSRESKSDDQLLFKTTGGVNIKRASLPVGSASLYYVNAMVMWLFIFRAVIKFIPFTNGYIGLITLPLLMVLSKVNNTGFPKLIEKMSKAGSSRWLRFMPVGALFLSIVVTPFSSNSVGAVAIPLWFIFDSFERGSLPQCFSCLQRVRHSRAILITGIVVALLVAYEFIGFVTTLAPLLLGNLQIPLSIARIVIPLWLRLEGDFNLVDPNKTHLVQALKTLYIVVMCQGTLYILACLLESLSYFPRTSLALHHGLVDKIGLESISIYYEQTYDTFVQESILDTKDIGLVNFAVNSLNSEVSQEKKLASVRILHSLLQQQEEPSNTEVVSEITGSTKVVHTVISMLGSRVPEDADIRLFATKVVAHLAPYLRITGFPGTMQMVSSLFHVENQPGRDDSSAQRVQGNTGNAGDQERSDAPISSRVDGNGGNAGDQQIGHTPGSPTADPEQGNAGSQETSHRPSSATLSNNGGNTDDQQARQSLNSSTLNVENSEDSLPVLGMLILERFADDVSNCAEISRATELLPRIIGLISQITCTTTPQQKRVTTSSLMLVAKLASIEWKSGVTLRKELSENPFLLSKLADILQGSCSGQEQWKPVMDIIAKLAMDEETSQEIGGIQVIIPKLMHIFVGRDEPSNTYDPSLRTAAGQALTMLAMQSAGNCSAILDEPGYNRIVDLNQMFIDDDNEYFAGNILRSLWEHCRCQPRHWDSLNSHMSPGFITEVLGRIMGAESKRMENLIAMASHICNAIPQDQSSPQYQVFINALESHLNAAAFVHKLVDELNANRRPNPEFPTMRRALVELTISIVESCGRYAAIFRHQGMVEALLTVEKTPSKVEKYRLYYGGTGVLPFPEGVETLSNLAATAKGRIAAGVNV